MAERLNEAELARPWRRGSTAIALTAMFALSLFAGCAQTPVSEEAIVYSSDWFACKSRFQCVVVQDSYCNSVAVNTRFAIVYQDWSRQQVEQAGERTACMVPDMQSPIPGCRRGRCVWPLTIERRRAKDGV